MNLLDKKLMMRSFYILSVIVAVSLTITVCYAANSKPAIKVGSEVEFPPFAIVDEKGQADGFSVELIKAVAKAMDLPIVITTGPWDTMWNGLVSGQLDVLPIVAKSPERQRLVDFSLSHTETFDAFFVRDGSPKIQDIKAAQGKKIVVMRSDAAHHALLEHKFQGEVVLVDTIPEGLKMVASGKNDAFLCSKLIGILAVKKHSIKGLTAGPLVPDYKRVFSFGVRKGADELREKLNQGLLIVKSSGEYDRIYEKWLGFDDPWRKYKRYLLIIVVVLSVIAVVAIFWSAMLRIMVKRRTEELAIKNEALEQEILTRKRIEEELRKHREELELLIEERAKKLQKTIAEVRTLRGILPICSYCKKIRNDKGYWEQMEMYIREHSEAEFSHGMCDDCAKKAFNELEDFKRKEDAE
ncbi:MAG: transporter substrate-binding domain-containing protein [Nitrospirae bacterium]|nr:transporter substrate-binding domain-containing protein [Nitrospirota bacterium]MCL5976895.1 transporter substrate-binding domain-containing protein [Nitrospirota bacterium]